ncbi:MAG: hypothetical protein JRG96_06750 [Deltaproteobacteria bacterium]|nr:hypothetical protein [Deltaproteobacteria bacterium]MBW2420160.1 hypothetical protein [Deltaproteobacteria bacterium]
MWGSEAWGTMLWGGSISVPLLGPVGLVALAASLLAGGALLRSRRGLR